MHRWTRAALIFACLVTLATLATGCHSAPTPESLAPGSRRTGSPRPAGARLPSPVSLASGVVASGAPTKASASSMHVRLRLRPPQEHPSQVVDAARVEKTRQLLSARLKEAGGRVIREEGSADTLILEMPQGTSRAWKWWSDQVTQRGHSFEFRRMRSDAGGGDSTWVAFLDEREVASCTVLVARDGGASGVTYELTPAGSRILAQVTSQMGGRPLGFFFDGRLMASQTVLEPIVGGRGTIPRVGPLPVAQEIAASLNRPRLPLQVEIIDRPPTPAP